MKKLTYSERLKHPLWQKKRLDILNRDDFKCQHCFDDSKTLHVHHKYYLRVEPWEYPDSAFITLCWDCHEIEEENLKCVCHDLIAIMKTRGAESSDFRSLATGFVLMNSDKIRGVIDIISRTLQCPNAQESAFKIIEKELPL